MLWSNKFIATGSALECYVCSNQTENTEKCLNTIKTCEQGEDVCLTEIRWGSQPYFTQGALKQYYVSKRCSTKKLCSTIRRKYMPYCTHIWYEDWTCSECCQGDRCNYYVIVSHSIRKFDKNRPFRLFFNEFHRNHDNKQWHFYSFNLFSEWLRSPVVLFVVHSSDSVTNRPFHSVDVTFELIYIFVDTNKQKHLHSLVVKSNHFY